MKAIGITVAVTVVLVIASLVAILLINNNRLQTELSVLKSNQKVEIITVADSIKSAEMSAIIGQLKAKDSIYNTQIKLLQNENQKLKTDYRRLFNDYSDIRIDRPRW